MLVSPALILDVFGGFSESEFLAMFRSVGAVEVQRLVRRANGTEIAIEGNRVVPFDEITAPLSSGRFPRAGLNDVAAAAYNAIFTVDRIPDSATQAYCAALSLYANIVSDARQLGATDWSAAMLYDAVGELGWYQGFQSAKFYLWCDTLHHGRSGVDGQENSRAICLIYAYLLAAHMFGDLGDTLVAQLSAIGDHPLGVVGQSCSPELNSYLGRELKNILKAEGTLATGAREVLNAAFQGIAHDYFANRDPQLSRRRRELGGRK